MSGEEVTMFDAPKTAFCTHRPRPGDRADLPCETCGHHLLVHVGVEHCPVCELVHHNQQMQAAMAVGRIEVHVTGVDARVLERTLERMQLRAATRGLARYRR